MNVIITKLGRDLETKHVYHAKPGKKGYYQIYVRIYLLIKTIKKHETLISTGIAVPKDKWLGRTIKGTSIETKIKNERLDDILDLIKDWLHDLKKVKNLNLQLAKTEIENDLKEKVTGKTPKGRKDLYLSKLAEHTITAVKDSYVATIPTATKTYKNNFRLAVQKFSLWWVQEHGEGEPNVSDISPYDCKQFKAWLERQPNIKHNTVSTYMGRLRTIFFHAVDRELITKSPIPRRGLIDGFEKGEQVSLTVDELSRIQNIPDTVLTPTQRRVKYIFLFLCSTGMGYGEMKSVVKEHIEQVEDTFMLTKARNKTQVEFTVLFSPQAKNIYTNFFKQSFDGLPSIEYVTRLVKQLAASAGINKNLTTYVGRKTFASQWMNDGNNIYYLQQILGHASTSTTMKYCNVDKEEMIKQSHEAYKKNTFHSQLN
ncbi:MAG: hypothetical protein EOO10_14365 [Chitinophagaceae bacterium]|nr:MAG: hypothetical protein EOO10_14365 [Chitinophagaceae bacterium]